MCSEQSLSAGMMQALSDSSPAPTRVREALVSFPFLAGDNVFESVQEQIQDIVRSRQFPKVA